jgi:hypothetical protein
VTDAAGNFDTATVSFTASAHSSSAPANAGSAGTACPAPLSVTPAAPTATQAFAPTSVAVNAPATLTLTLSNSNEFALTQTALTQTMPANLVVATTPAASSTCGGALRSLSSTSGAVTLNNALIPAQGSCTVTFSVQSATAGAYSSDIAVGALSTGPAGSNVDATTASLTVTGAPAAAGGSGGGGEIDWLDILFVTGLLLACRRRRPVAIIH